MGFGPIGPWSESFRLNEVLFLLRSSRVYYPCIPGVEMLGIRILLASPLLALRCGWEAEIMNKHTPIMDTFPTNVVSSRKRLRAYDSSDDESQHEDNVIEFDRNWNLTWSRFIVLSPVDVSEPLTKLSPFATHLFCKQLAQVSTAKTMGYSSSTAIFWFLHWSSQSP